MRLAQPIILEQQTFGYLIPCERICLKVIPSQNVLRLGINMRYIRVDFLIRKTQTLPKHSFVEFI
jgi:hypothetical protein